MISYATTINPKACKVCGDPFLPFLTLQVVCSVKCAKRIPAFERKQTKLRIDALQPLSHWLKQAQQAFNAWIRERDKDWPCISCGRFHQGKWNAGHYLSTGARPELRFDPMNVHRQCEPCNTNLSGNLIRYRVNLIERIGQAEVDRLEGPHAPKRYRAEDLKAIRDDYRARLRQQRFAAL